MVGGFVQQQHLGLADQCPCQRHAPPPATGQLRHFGVGGQLQLAECCFHPLLQIPAVNGFQFMLHPR